jgi:LuxR family maltose regulon positive regulatory protein
VEALRGRLRRSAQLASRNPAPAALVALAWVHLDRQELAQARGYLQQADAALAVTGDKLTGTLAQLTAGWCALAGGRPEAAAQIIARARAGWPVPAWLGQQLSLALSRAWAAAGDIAAALAAARQAGGDRSPEAAVTLAHARAAAGDGDGARRVLAPALAAGSGASDRARVQAWLVDARISCRNGDGEQARQSLVRALRLAAPEQLRLPFAMERSWIVPVLRRYPGLADSHQDLLAPIVRPGQLPPPVIAPEPAPIVVIEPLSERETQVLRHVSSMLSTAEVASELYISTNTVKTHLRSIYRKLAVTHRGEAVRRARQLELI